MRALTKLLTMHSPDKKNIEYFFLSTKFFSKSFQSPKKYLVGTEYFKLNKLILAQHSLIIFRFLNVHFYIRIQSHKQKQELLEAGASILGIMGGRPTPLPLN